MRQPALLDSQLWLLTAMTAQGGLEHGLDLARASCGLDEALVALPPRGERRDRVGVYHHGYWARLLECLRADYPMLGKLLGPPLFDFFARGYIASRPSRTPSLYDFGAGFADFLADSQPAAAVDEYRLPVELARLERACAEASRAQGIEDEEGAPDEWLPLLAAASSLADFAVPDSVRLLKVSLPVHVYWRELQEGDEPPAAPAAQTHWLAVARSQWRVRVHELEHWQFQLLASLAEAGLGGEPPQALREDERLRARLFLWLPAARQLGLLRRA
ncbi:HvfC/BufC N-terminal domain-containing protein [Chromobacterium alticapitis]|uniref:DUF2063 domain-containing protein n=1 Tax=Chromobacterium alticapitis TaxID=2073169 RepID=A0A2S5DFM1_9NEIS|nr:DNA-binding domain-containing protein [Chromobacterium alticapitis]POZ61811.1 DUF2063 domain-containing protein [Chromobacterium alticapitis]